MLKTKTTKKLIIGIMAVALIVTVIGVANSNFAHAEDIKDDPGDPGNSPGPGNDPLIGSIIIDDIPFDLSMDLNDMLLQDI